MKRANPIHQLRSLVRRARRAVSGAVRHPRFGHDTALRERFQYEGLVRCRRGVRLFCWLAIALLAVSAVNSYFQEPQLFLALLGVRVASMVVLGIILSLLASRLGRRRPRELALLFVLTLGLTFHALALAAPAQAGVQYDRMNLVVLGLAVLITWSPAWSAAACGIMIAVYVAGAVVMWQGPPATEFGHHLIRLVAT